jgi:hypothetical protein
MNFINYYRLERELGNVEIGTIFIIGFSERAFKNELLSHPEFGFLTKSEKHKIDKLKRLAAIGSKQDIDRYQDLIIKIKKRFSNRKGNGFFRFYGYKAFVNRIFVTNAEVDLNSMTEPEIRKALLSGKLKYNEELFAQFKNSLIICDEIHNVYNSLEQNNWGIAIQAVLDKEPTCRAVFASATPFNNSPTEIVDLLNLLLPANQRVNKDDFFIKVNKPKSGTKIKVVEEKTVVEKTKSIKSNNKKKELEDNYIDQEDLYASLKPNALERIAELCKGRISYLQDLNPKNYPSVSLEGEVIKGIPYLKFIRCVMSKYHYDTYKSVYNGTLMQDSQYLVDFVIENPDGGLGLYQTQAIKNALTNASTKWKDKYGFNYVNNRIVGDALRYENLGKYSAKAVRILDEIQSCIKNQRGKIFIYHNVVHMSGVLFIEQVLLKNGYIDEFSTSTDDTICCVCGKRKKEHSKEELLDDIVGSSNVMDADIVVDNTMDDVLGGTTMLDDHHNCIKLIKTKKKIEWVRNEESLLTIHRQKHHYLILAGNIHNRLLNAESHALKELSAVFDQLDQLPILVQVPRPFHRLGEWLLQMGFKLHSTTSKYILYTFGYKKVGGRSKPDEHAAKYVGDKKLKIVYLGGKHHSSNHKNHNKHKRNNHATHKFRPTRFVMAHSEIDKSTMDHSLEKFNSIDNTDGYRFYILVGSRIIKESYNTKAICNVFIAGRPDAMPPFIQIRGRAVRNGSHKHLPPSKRHVRVLVFTTCLPIKDKHTGQYALSYEEEKYKEKVHAFQVMQLIEKTMHEVAIDSYINYNWSDLVYKNDPLSALPYKPLVDKKFNHEFTLDELNLSTFNAYHAKQEVNTVKVIIKRLFIEYSPVWELNDLYQAIRNYTLDVEINTRLVSNENILIAMNQLSWYNSTEYTEPMMQHTTLVDDQLVDNQSIVVDRLYDLDDKIITLPNGQNSIIVPITSNGHSNQQSYKPSTNQQYFMLFPIQLDGTPDIDIDAPYRATKLVTSQLINMNHFIQTKRIDFDYDDKKKIFYNKYADISIENMENTICEYGTNFHIKFIEECITYVFRAWTDPTLEKHPMHEFYFKMLYYYDLLSLVLWAYTCKPKVFKHYTKYAIPVHAKDIKLKTLHAYEKRESIMEKKELDPEDNSDLATSGIINLLKVSLNRTSNVWVPQEFREEFDKTVQASLKLFAGRRKKSKVINKVSAMYLPIGHFISKFPKLYQPTTHEFIEDPQYKQLDENFKENDFIIGFDDRSATGVHIRFKLRQPIQNIKKHKDTRTIERGVVCKSKSKTDLRKISKQLDVILDEQEKYSVDDLCNLVRSKLIRLELKERIKKSKIKWFYWHWEDSERV